jgi:probable HAF family extracellular repeat protein
MFAWLWSRQTAGKSLARRRRRKPPPRLRLEALEDRYLLSYSITDLGTLGGPYITSAAYGINAAGQVVGVTDGGSGAYHEAFLWQNGVMQDLGVHGQASGINSANSVEVVGTMSASNGPYAFLWQNGTTQNLGGGYATGVNDSGQVVGTINGAFLWQNGTMQNLGTLPGDIGSGATAINNSSQVVGISTKVHTTRKTQTYTDTAFLWQNGNMISLGTLGGQNSDAYAINDLGQVVGTADTKTSFGHAFLWDSTHGMKDLGFQGSPKGINAAGQIVGTMGGGGGEAFLWQNGVLQDLNTLIPTGSGWVLQWATAINGSGQIVGWGTINNGYVHGFLLTPSTTITALAQPAANTWAAASTGQPTFAAEAGATPLSSNSGATLTTGPLIEISNPDPLANCPPSGFQPPDEAAEPYVAVNPANPKNIVAEWIDHGFAGNVAGVSFDGGKTWQNVAIPGITQCTGGTETRAADPWLSFAPNGNLYSIGVAEGLKGNGQLLVSKSTDGGMTWSGPIQVNSPGNSGNGFGPVIDDKPSITADPTNPNLVYATWAEFNDSKPLSGNSAETMFARSTDGGLTWQPEQTIHTAPGTSFDWGNQIVVLPNGTLIDAFCEGQFTNNDPGVLTLLRSSDHGQTWSAPIAAVVQEPLIDPRVQPPNALVTDPNTGQAVEAHPMFDSIAVDPNSGNLYAVWIDARFSNGQHNSIALSMSSDGGFTWSTPIQANQTPNTVPPLDRQAWNPTVAVAANGTVAVTYYDFRNNTGTGGALTDYWLAMNPAPATNPGTWSEVRLTNTSFNLEQAPTRFNGAFFLGDYEGLAAAGNDFVAVWGMPDGSATGQESIFFRDPPAETDASPPSLPQGSSVAVATAAFHTAFDVGILVPPANGMFNLPGDPPAADGRLVSPALSPAVTAIDQVFAKSPWNSDDLGFTPSRPRQEGLAVDLLAAGLADSLLQQAELPG